jgi:peroxiredoxin
MASAKQKQMLGPGERAPEFDLEDLDGRHTKLKHLVAAGPVLLAFFKVSCPTCQFTFPFLERIYRGATDHALKMFAISQDDARANREFRQEFGITFPTLLDSERNDYPVSNAYGISHVPTLFLVEPDGSISWTLDGFNKKELQALGAKFGVNTFKPNENVPEMKPG